MSIFSPTRLLPALGERQSVHTDSFLEIFIFATKKTRLASVRQRGDGGDNDQGCFNDLINAIQIASCAIANNYGTDAIYFRVKSKHNSNNSLLLGKSRRANKFLLVVHCPTVLFRVELFVYFDDIPH
jgi:hypothetical protein